MWSGSLNPVLAKQQARICTRMTAAQTIAQVDQVIDAITGVGRELGVIT